jgi:hypothetical protein
MPKRHGYQYIVVAREGLSGYLEARALRNADSKSVTKFLYKDVLCRYGCFHSLIVNGGPENAGFVINLANNYGIRRIQVSPYHP